MITDARAATALACTFMAVVLTDQGPTTILALAPCAVMLRDGGVATALACASYAFMLTDCRAFAALAIASSAVVLTYGAATAAPALCSICCAHIWSSHRISFGGRAHRWRSHHSSCIRLFGGNARKWTSHHNLCTPGRSTVVWALPVGLRHLKPFCSHAFMLTDRRAFAALAIAFSAVVLTDGGATAQKHKSGVGCVVMCFKGSSSNDIYLNPRFK
jgi:hypothetical protein